MKFNTVLAACALLLSGCGGGSSDNTTPAPQANAAGAAGMWQGTTSTNRTVYAAVLANGTSWVLYTSPGNPTVIAGVVEGTASGGSNPTGVLTSNDALDFNLEAQAIFPATVTAVYAQGNFLNGTIHYTTLSQTTTFNTSALAAPAPTLSRVAGTYVGAAAVVGGAEAATVSVTTGGAISGVGTSGCRFTGTAAPRTDAPVFDVTVTFAGAPCLNGTSTTVGVAFLDVTTNRLYAAAVNSGRSNGFLFAGGKV
jgi:hypothetical protein